MNTSFVDECKEASKPVWANEYDTWQFFAWQNTPFPN